MEEYYHVTSKREVKGLDTSKPFYIFTTSPIVFPKEMAEERAKEWQDFTHWPHTVSLAEEDYPKELHWIPDMKTWPVNQTKDLIDSATHIHNL